MTPIEKNIIVVDEKGNEYEATYPKRAKGLVKSGRARFIAENKICIACPPDNTEDKEMSENINNTANSAEKVTTDTSSKYTLDYVLTQIEKIASNTEYIDSVLTNLSFMQNSAPGDIAGEAKAEALATLVGCRETTNQKLIAFYEKIYDDLKPKADTAEKSNE